MKTLQELALALRRQRRNLRLNQKDMLMRIGMSQQQYQRIESGGDLRVSTLLRILEGVDLELMVVTKEQHNTISENSGAVLPESLPWGELIDSLADKNYD